MRCLFLMLTLLGSIPFLLAEEVRLVDLDPPEAQQIIDKQDVSLNYAPKVDTNVPAVRYLGEEPHHVLEDVYLAKQYHGQDGLGGYLYGYNVPDIAKTERKKAGGDLRGAYNYIAGNGQEIKVEYWDDGTGFHQIDNVPKILPKQIDDLPEVQAEKDKFLARWHEEAERNSRPVANPYNDEGQYASGPLSAQGQLEAKLQLQQQPNQYQASSQYQYGQYQQENQNNKQPTQYQAGQYQQPGQYQATGQYQKPQESQYTGQYQATGQYQKPQSQENGQYQATGQYQKPQSQENGQYQATGQYQKPQESQSSGQYQATGQYQKPQSQENGQYQETGQYQKPQSQENGQYQATGQYQKPQESQSSGQYQATGQYQKPQSQENGQYQATGQYQKPQESQSSGQYQATGQYQKPQSQENGQYQATGQYQKPQESQYTGQYQQPGLNQIDYTGQYSENQNVYSSPVQSSSSGNGQGNEIDNSGKYVKTDDEETTGPPKGFFYSFDYPVGIIVQKGDLVRNGEVKNVYDENKAKFESQLRSGRSNGSSQSGYLYVKN